MIKNWTVERPVNEAKLYKTACKWNWSHYTCTHVKKFVCLLLYCLGRNNECILVLHGHIPLFFHAFLILIISIFSEWQGGRWKVTKVKKPKPGRSAEKLREQMEKLQLDYN